jgi:putative oxidoreductase
MDTMRLADVAAAGISPLTQRRIDWCLDRLGRLAVATLFIDAARWHVSSAGWTRTLNDMQARGVPADKPLLILAMIASSLLALALLFGIKPRWSALGLAIYTISVSLVMYNPFAHLGEAALILFLKDLCIFGALLSLSCNVRETPWPRAGLRAAS